MILPRLKGDLLPLLEMTIDGKLDAVKIEMDRTTRGHGRDGVGGLSGES